MLDPRLNHVVAAAQQGSFTAAARVVGVTQSAITKSIAELERQLGYLIFHRTSRGALLTEAGRGVRRSRDAAAAGRQGPAARARRARGRLRRHPAGRRLPGLAGVAAGRADHRPAGAASEPALRRQRGQLRAHGAAAAQRRRRCRGRLRGRLLRAAGLPRASRWRRRRPPSSRARTIRSCGTRRWARPRSPATRSSRPTDSRPYGARIRDIFESQGVDAQSRIHTVDFFPLVKRIVATTDAISVVATAYTRTAAFKRSFAVLETVDQPPVARLCVAVRARWAPRPAVRAFISACRVSLSPEAYQAAG